MHFRHFPLFALTLLAVSLQAHAASCNANSKITIAYDTQTGVAANLLSYDVYAPAVADGVKVPVIVYVHGGAWVIGDKAAQQTDKTSFFPSLGYVYISVNYRLSANILGGDAPNGVVYPIHNQDVAKALQHIMVNTGEKFCANTSNIGLFGHSAGAGIVAALALNPMLLNGASKESCLTVSTA